MALALLGACGGPVDETADEAWYEDAALGPDDEEAVLPAAADDEPIGSGVDEPDPEPGDDPCLEHDECATEPNPAEGEEESTTPAEPDSPSADGYEVGDVLLTLTYAPLRTEPSNQADKADVHSGGGAHGGHPKGTVPPGQAVTLLAAAPTDGFYRVDYRGHEGWISRKKLALFDTSVHPVKFARRADVRNAFFMHQLLRARWNKDGLSSTGNCAPTSLAMAAKIFGYGTEGKTIEKSIHEARSKYDPAPLCESCGTSRADIRLAAQKLGFHVRTLDAIGGVEFRMDRIDQALSNEHVVVLEGYAGSAYRQRMTEAYQSSSNEWIRGRVYTFGDDPGEYHSILVVSRLDSGKYLVADPLSEVGMVTMNRATLKSFFSRWGGTGNVVW